MVEYPLGLSVDDVLRALDQFGHRYDSIDVFVDDVIELRRWAETDEPPKILEPVSSSTFRLQGTKYQLEVFPEHGVARFSVHGPQQGTGVSMGEGAVAGGLLGAAIAAAIGKKSELGLGVALGLLVGGFLAGNSPQHQAKRRVFALCFNPETGDWESYDGGLVGWMKRELGHVGV